MPASNESHLGQFVPGFDFLQGLARNASSALPGLSQWIAPTLNPEEIEKRISELRTVQFWLEQNARLLATTIQALEVQRMTLATLKSMNVPVGTLHESLRARTADDAAVPRPKPAAAGEGAAGLVDPMQWWGALTQQFTDLAASAMQDALKDGDKARAKSTPPSAATPKAPASESEARPPPAARTAPATEHKATTARRRERSSGPPVR
jgi:hypothetical protein